MSSIHPDILEEAMRLVGAAAEEGVPIRLIGGLAVRLHAPHGVPPGLAREFNDIDFATLKGKGKDVTRFLESTGYKPNKIFNNMNAGRRSLFYDTENGRQVDVFVGSFDMCHEIPIAGRIELEPVTIPLAELLLTKLQIVQLNEKDQRDILALVHEHEVGEDDFDMINAAHIAHLLAADWGLWRTSKMNIERSRSALRQYDLPQFDRERLDRRLAALWSRIEAEPKSAKWKLRDRVGDRKKWYMEPDEVG
jgi:hypothetical protein